MAEARGKILLHVLQEVALSWQLRFTRLSMRVTEQHVSYIQKSLNFIQKRS